LERKAVSGIMLSLLLTSILILAPIIQTAKTVSAIADPAVVRGNTLIADWFRVIELDSVGNIVWQITGLNGASDVERLSNGNTLIVEADADRVIEVDPAGNIVWQKTELQGVNDAERLSNGNTLISEFFGMRVIEVNIAGDVVWQITELLTPEDAEYLPNGNVLISLWNSGLVFEVDLTGNIVWSCETGSHTSDAERQLNGNTLMTKSVENRVIEVDYEGNIVWELSGLDFPSDVERLSDGNTLIADLENNRVIEVNDAGDLIWEVTGLYHPGDVERIELFPVIPATTDIEPDTLNLKSKGKWTTAYIQLPVGYNPEDIDAATILLNETIQPVLDPKYGFVTNSSEYIVDNDGDGILERMVKFNRTEVASWICNDLGIQYGDVALTITGELFDGTPFEGTDVIKVLFPGDVDDDRDVDGYDLSLFTDAYGTNIEDVEYDLAADLNEDQSMHA